MNSVTDEVKFEPVTLDTQDIAKSLILEGLAERFGFIDYSLNPDLNNIVDSYLKQGNIFLIGSIQGELICTGALVYEEKNIGRIVRMSVKKEYRRQGLANRTLEKLEEIAKDMGYTRLVLETNIDWRSATQFYKSCGFIKLNKEDGLIHMSKELMK